MSWSTNISGTPSSVVEQLTNLPAPQSQTEAGQAQFTAARFALISQAKKAGASGLGLIRASASGHGNDDGTGSFQGWVSITAPPIRNEFVAPGCEKFTSSEPAPPVEPAQEKDLTAQTGSVNSGV